MSRKKRKKRLKLRKKGVFVLSLLLLVVIMGLYFCMYYKDRQNLKDIKKYYNKYVITKNKTNLYDKNKHKIGTIKKNFPLELKEIDTNNVKTKYLQIKDTDYYISFLDLKKAKNKENTDNTTNYLVFNKNIKTNKSITLYQNKKKVITLKNINIPVEYKDNNNYYVSLFNQIFSIPKKKVKKLVDSNNTKEKSIDTIQLLSYKDINDSCSGYDCVNTQTLEDHINKLKENGYYMISKDEYNKFINGNIRLRDKAMMISVKEENDFVKRVNEATKSFISTIDNSNSKNVKTHEIKSYTTVDNLLKMANGEDVSENPPVINNQGIAVLNYHFFYDSTIGESCNETICLDTVMFRQHLDYLKENNYKTVTMNEFKRWMYGEIELPEKSVLITVDDGALGTGKHNGNKLIPLLEEYKMHATLFLIAGWWDIENYRSPYLDIQSHTFDMHQYGSCGNGQINCATYEEAKADLNKSLEIIKNNDSFCFPFYYYSDTSLKAVKDAGFKLAFVGGMRKATRNSNKYLIPRYPIHSTHTFKEFVSMVS